MHPHTLIPVRSAGNRRGVIKPGGGPVLESSIHFAAMPDPHDEHHEDVIAQGIHPPPIPDAQTV